MEMEYTATEGKDGGTWCRKDIEHVLLVGYLLLKC